MSADQPSLQAIPAGEFKNRCLAIMDEVNETGTGVLITKHGRPVSRLVPAERSAPEMWGRYRDVVRVSGDIVSPVLPSDDWEAVWDPVHVADPSTPDLR